jgi:BolA protein
MSTQAIIEQKLAEGLEPLHLEVVNERSQHNVPPGSESHFKVVVVSDAFQAKSPVQRHRLVYGLLEQEMKGAVHALAVHAYTRDDWEAAHGAAPLSPPCRGGSKVA